MKQEKPTTTNSSHLAPPQSTTTEDILNHPIHQHVPTHSSNQAHHPIQAIARSPTNQTLVPPLEQTQLRAPAPFPLGAPSFSTFHGPFRATHPATPPGCTFCGFRNSFFRSKKKACVHQQLGTRFYRLPSLATRAVGTGGNRRETTESKSQCRYASMTFFSASL